MRQEEQQLRKFGYRITPQRLAVLKTLEEADGHLSPLDIYNRAHSRMPGLGLVTVYRSLRVLAAAGLACEIEFGDGGRHYARRVPSGHHHHLICTGCEGVVDFGDCALPALELRLAENTGFSITGHRLEFFGLCRHCQAEGSRNGAGTI